MRRPPKEPTVSRQGEEVTFYFGSAAVKAYEAGRYEEAYVRLLALIDEDPELLGECFSYLYTCERVMTTLPDARDRECVIDAGKPLRRLFAPFRGQDPVRCKWCGHYTHWEDPDDEGTCYRCGATYPVPTWRYDSPFMMAHSEGRGSWSEDSENSRIWNQMCDRYEREAGEVMR